VSLLACTTENNKIQTLSDKEWKDILLFTAKFTVGNKGYILNNYENIEVVDIISDSYINNTDLGYDFNDSILNYIGSRKNSIITNRLDTIANICFIYDTNNFKENLIIYSEPFYVSKTILCLSMTYKKNLQKITEQKIFFFRKKHENFIFIEFYDVNKDKYYRPVEINQ